MNNILRWARLLPVVLLCGLFAACVRPAAAQEEEYAVVSMESATVMVDESVGSATIRMVRTGRADVAVTAEYRVADISTVAGSDYTAPSGVLEFAH